MIEQFEDTLRKDLHQFLLSMKEVDERLPECPACTSSTSLEPLCS